LLFEWHNALINFAMQNVAIVTNTDAVIRAIGEREEKPKRRAQTAPPALFAARGFGILGGRRRVDSAGRKLMK
jgi:hypothetical protein